MSESFPDRDGGGKGMNEKEKGKRKKVNGLVLKLL